MSSFSARALDALPCCNDRFWPERTPILLVGINGLWSPAGSSATRIVAGNASIPDIQAPELVHLKRSFVYRSGRAPE